MKSKETILIVDDNRINQQLLSKIVTTRGYQAIFANNGQEAIDVARVKNPDLILLDIMMPVMDGFETCHHLKQDKVTQDIPVIFVTAMTRRGSVSKAFEVGASDYISEPVVKEEVIARVELHLSLKSANEKIRGTLEALEKSHDDLITILNQLQVGTVIIEADGSIAFMSESCDNIKGIDRYRAIGKQWKDVCPFLHDSKELLDEQLRLPNTERRRVTLTLEAKAHKRYTLDVEVKDDPRVALRSIVCLYDVTEIHQLRNEVRRSNYVQIIGNSEVMRSMFTALEQVSKGDWTVLIEGETGSGKELVARSIHNVSSRKNGPFIAVNCAGLTESLLASQLFGHRRGAFTGAVSDQTGFFEAAENGTLFLDEIGEIPLTMQATLLRALQEHEIIRLGDTVPQKVNVRVLTATNQNLGEMVSRGMFREDLLYRIRVARISVPPLRERIGDLPILIDSFLAESRITMGKPTVRFDEDTLGYMYHYTWPGNVRELKNVVDHCIIHAEESVIRPKDLPLEIKSDSVLSPPSDPSPSITIFPADVDEETAIREALRTSKGNRSKAAKLLGVSRATFYRKLSSYKIHP